MLGVIPGGQHSLGTDTPKTKGSVPAGASGACDSTVPPAPAQNQGGKFPWGHPRAELWQLRSCFFAKSCSQGTGAKPRALASSLASGGGGMEVFFQPPEMWQGEQIPRARRGVGWGGSPLPREGKKGEKATWECGKIFLFLLFFCLETTVWCWQCLNTGCVVSLSCCRSVNSVSGKSPLTPSCLCSPRHFQCQALLGLNPDQLPNPMARGHKSPILGPAGTGPVLGAVFVPRGRRQV